MRNKNLINQLIIKQTAVRVQNTAVQNLLPTKTNW